jgi:hypothetical protein
VSPPKTQRLSAGAIISAERRSYEWVGMLLTRKPRITVYDARRRLCAAPDRDVHWQEDVVNGHRTWELFPDNGGYLGALRQGKRQFVICTDDIGKLGLPIETERELRAFHELATGDAGGTGPDYASVLRALDKLSETDFKEWAVGLADRLGEALGKDWTVRVSDNW